MTTYQLQKDLAEEIEQITEDMLFQNPEGKPEHMKAFLQDLPKREQTVQPGNLMVEEDEDDPYPFCVVRLESGAVLSGAQAVTVILVFGIFDDGMENLGHQSLLNVIHRVSERFISNPVLKDRYQMDVRRGINWILDEEDRYPYYIGGLEMTWNAYFVERGEDQYV
ncbi:MAG: hypothetical protein NC416_08195 [Eubacterium sp.]|nr:hypothetical protein [Eubacterium sp.]